MSDPGFYWYEGDYLRDTSHLLDLEDLAYRRLLGAYHSRQQPLPADLGRLCQIARLPAAIVQPVADEFLPIASDGLRHNSRADRIIADRKAFLIEQGRKAKLGGAARWEGHVKNARGDARGDTPGMPGALPEGMPGRCPSSSSSSSSSDPQKTTPIPPEGEDSDVHFLEFWQMYPKRVGKGLAFRSWKKIKGDKNKLLDEIGIALGWQCESENWKKENGKYIPNPATYLNQHRWKDGKELAL